MKKDAAGVYPYSSIFDAMAKVYFIISRLLNEKELLVSGLGSQRFTLE
jgi:hypothetical protein